jgi:hypothetical protein
MMNGPNPALAVRTASADDRYETRATLRRETQGGKSMSLVGTRAPDFKVASTRNLSSLDTPVSLEDYRGRWVFLVFYPRDFTFV